MATEKEISKEAEFLIKKIVTDFQYWQAYLNIFQEKEKEFGDKKNDITRQLKENPNSEQAKDAMIFIQYSYEKHLSDLRLLLNQLIGMYKVAEALDLTTHFTDSLNEKMQRAMDAEGNKCTFFVDGKKLEERIKGGRDKFVKEFEQNPMYKQVMQMVVDQMEKNGG
jgi:hypothetical protein